MAFLMFCGWLLRKFNEDETYEELKREHQENQIVHFRDDVDLRFDDIDWHVENYN